MYHLPHFKENDSAVIRRFMEQNAFVLLVGCYSNLPVVTQVPLLLEDRDDKLFLKGHVMRGTDHYKAFVANNNVLCVFAGAHAYVSASWYTTPQSASTWNYMTVQAKGVLQFLDEDALLDILKRTTDHFENDPASPAAYQHLSKDYVYPLAKAIAGFEIEVTQLQHTFKLSQNRDKESYKAIIQNLSKGDKDAQAIAAEMEQRSSQLFDTEK